ncbi:MAG: nucleotidyltransferase family protein [Clostridiales bacterium]|jgi:CTP:molybdopterin cytidylyltransferase MocA|nr:nucleotidyltransferase family protein [Clostridiales bacterium]
MKNTFAAVILAAGYSSRIGEFKPLLPIGEKATIYHIIDSFLNVGIKDIYVVTGYRGNELEAVLGAKNVKSIFNPRFPDGMFSSIQAGCRALKDSAKAFFLAPVDTPLFEVRTINAMIERYSSGTEQIIFPSYARRRGHPALISAAIIPHILNADVKSNLRDILENHGDYCYVTVEDKGILLDMDVLVDYERLREYYKPRQTM